MYAVVETMDLHRSLIVTITSRLCAQPLAHPQSHRLGSTPGHNFAKDKRAQCNIEYWRQAGLMPDIPLTPATGCQLLWNMTETRMTVMLHVGLMIQC